MERVANERRLSSSVWHSSTKIAPKSGRSRAASTSPSSPSRRLALELVVDDQQVRVGDDDVGVGKLLLRHPVVTDLGVFGPYRHSSEPGQPNQYGSAASTILVPWSSSFCSGSAAIT
jgi:hypothetical protein